MHKTTISISTQFRDKITLKKTGSPAENLEKSNVMAAHYLNHGENLGHLSFACASIEEPAGGQQNTCKREEKKLQFDIFCDFWGFFHETFAQYYRS